MLRAVLCCAHCRQEELPPGGAALSGVLGASFTTLPLLLVKGPVALSRALGVWLEVSLQGRNSWKGSDVCARVENEVFVGQQADSQ